jgi:uncharacterized protein
VTRDDLAATLVQLRRRVDAHFDAALTRTPAAFRCAEGCSACCEARFSVFAVEAAPIRQALARLGQSDPALRARIRDQADDPAHQHHCALLVDARCTVYAERPLICRSHGLPIAADDHISHCPLNFTDAPPPPATVLRLDAVNQPLAVLATLWDQAEPQTARSPAPSDPSATRIALADLARTDAYPPPVAVCGPPPPPHQFPAPAPHNARKND